MGPILIGVCGGIIVMIVLVLISIANGKKDDLKRQEWLENHEQYVQEHIDDINRCERQFKDMELMVNAKYPTRYTYQKLEVCNHASNIIFLEKQHIMPDFSMFSPEEFISYKPQFPEIMYEVPLNKIIYFREVGDVQYTTDISGGKVSGGGVSIGGAIVGGLVAGETGAIIGSRQSVKSEGITSTTIEHDSRQVVLKLTDDEVRFDIEIYDIFMKLIPEKEYTYIMATKNEEGKQQKSTVDKLKDGKELLDAGLITEEEFQTLKNELLSAK